MKRLFALALARYGGRDVCRFGMSLPRWIRLFAALFLDRRVGLAPRLALLGAAAYTLSLFDLSPDLIPLLGQLDDLAVLTMGCRLFLQLAPGDVVAEHAARIRGPHVLEINPARSPIRREKA